MKNLLKVNGISKKVSVLKYLPLDIVTKENVNYYADEENEVLQIG